jgi:hypothetical protein
MIRMNIVFWITFPLKIKHDPPDSRITTFFDGINMTKKQKRTTKYVFSFFLEIFSF